MESITRVIPFICDKQLDTVREFVLTDHLVSQINTMGICVQIWGMLFIISSIMILIKREQNKASAELLLASVASLTMNITYFFAFQSSNEMEAMLAYKIQYAAGACFYLFFVLFCLTFLDVHCPDGVFYAWGIVEAIGIFLIWDPRSQVLFIKNVSLREIQESGGFHYIQVEAQLGYLIRLSLIATVLIGVLSYAIARMVRTVSKTERRKVLILIVAIVLSITTLFLEMFAKSQFDTLPFFSSIAVFFITLRVATGDFFNVTDEGRTWVFEHMESIFFIVDNGYGFLDANEKARKRFPELAKYEKGIRIPQYIIDLVFSGKNKITYENCYYEAIITELKETPFAEQNRTSKKDYYSKCFPQKSKKRREKKMKNMVRGYSVILKDITEQHQLMEELLEAKQRAEEANRAKSSFMSNMSHEIRTPMNAIVGMTDIMLRMNLNEQQQGYLMNIKNSGNALLTIINDILDFSKIESGKLSIIEEEYEPMSLFSDLGMIFLTRIANKKVEFIYDIDPKIPLKLCGDSLRIRQVLINIVNNAIKFTDEGCVKLKVRMGKKFENRVELLFSVSDTGQGIKEEDMGKLFQSFGQVDTKKNHEKEGTGLGLAISKQLVELMGGSIGVRSAYTKGSEFYFSMYQKFVTSELAAEIHEEENKKKIICANFSNAYQTENIKSLAQAYGMRYVDVDSANEQHLMVDYFFMDGAAYQKSGVGVLRNRAEDTTVVVLQNPLRESIDRQDLKLVNKPLYSLNFCQIINREKIGYMTKSEQLLNFKAPSAKVLVTDDNELNLKVAQGLLAPYEVDVDVAVNGKQAIQMMEEKAYDIVFMDHMMPVMDGIETVHVIRHKKKDYFKRVPIIALTANAVSGAKDMFLRSGMNDFVSKPIEQKELSKCLRKWLPEDKIIDPEKEELWQEETPQTEENQVLPGEIPGINRQMGIRNTGSEQLFVELLGDFYKIIDIKANEIESYLAEEMLHEYTIEVHALKNVARTIGAMELSDSFHQMEECGRAGDIETIRRENPRIMEIYRGFKQYLKPYVTYLYQKRREATAEELIGILREMRMAMEDFDIDTVDAKLKELEELQIPSECEEYMDRLEAFAANLAMEQIIETIDNMIEIIEEKGK